MKTVKIFIGLLAFVAMSCGGGDHHAELVELTPVPVQVARAKEKTTGDFVSASGKVEAQKSANLSTRMMGNVSALKVKVGESVTKGQLILSINSTDLSAKRSQVEAGIKQAESAYKNAEKDYIRFKTLYEKGSASEKELDDMTTRYEMAKAGLESAKQMQKEIDAQFTYTNIRAPFDGVVTNTFVKEGDIASPGYPLATVEGNQGYEAMVMVSESEISKVKTGAEATIFIKSVGKEYGGIVSEVSLSGKNTGGQFLVKVDIPEAGAEVLPGMFVNARLMPESGVQNGALMVPQAAIITKGQLKGIYTVTGDNKAILRWLRLGRASGDMVEVLSGLAVGETYVTSAKGKLFNGAPVTL